MSYKLVVQYTADHYTEVLCEGTREEMVDAFDALIKRHSKERYFDKGDEKSASPWIIFKGRAGEHFERVKVWLCDDERAKKIIETENTFFGHADKR